MKSLSAGLSVVDGQAVQRLERVSSIPSLGVVLALPPSCPGPGTRGGTGHGEAASGWLAPVLQQ